MILSNLINAALVGIDFGKIDFEASLEELSLLAQSAGANPLVTLTGRRSSPDAKVFVDYDGRLGSHLQEHSASGGLKVRF